MKNSEESEPKLCSSLSINLELEVAQALTDLATPLEIDTHDLQVNSELFWSSGNVESVVQSSPLNLGLWGDNEVGNLFVLFDVCIIY